MMSENKTRHLWKASYAILCVLSGEDWCCVASLKGGNGVGLEGVMGKGHAIYVVNLLPQTYAQIDLI